MLNYEGHIIAAGRPLKGMAMNEDARAELSLPLASANG